MNKIWNGLRYGNKKTKGYILATILLLSFGSVSVGFTVAKKSPLWGMSAIFCFLVAFLFITSLSFHKTGKQIIKKTREEHALSDDISNEHLEEEIEENIFGKYDEETVKGVFIKYKVNKDHKPIIIDHCQSEKVRQCPAYIWSDRGNLNLLLFEEETRKITIPLSKVTKIIYEKGVLADPLLDYEGFQKPSFLKMVFSSYLPTLYEDSKEGRKVYRKNLYVLSPDIKVTNTSIRTIMDMLKLDLSYEGRFADPGMHNPYFEKAYLLSIMLRDGVITVSEFKVRIKKLLQQLSEANISNDEFHLYIRQMVNARLITKDYAEYYLAYRK
ncbi:hypothetical protein [Lachnoclostridium phytofermentans]|uniref:Uncharacterized protein n=1 Tax=Lachnoclostridium phytofermentans (strain ATCC 700394 / DSM 18823 / ISDg) TaxID=357809 RepID=A9KQ92_LACP7|nr:hypothetical protein [Lachnoclostridium phytofermentans]ABX43404.1 hypothetical protein Cphy_3047 [Lachnoclostridium phytofermentans ISDg]